MARWLGELASLLRHELWEFASDGRMARREASINDVAISALERRFTWTAPGPRPADVPDIDAVR